MRKSVHPHIGVARVAVSRDNALAVDRLQDLHEGRKIPGVLTRRSLATILCTMPAFSSTDELTVFSNALTGQYEVEREIGRGGMGVVYLARDLRLARMVAVKTLPLHLANDAPFASASCAKRERPPAC